MRADAIGEGVETLPLSEMAVDDLSRVLEVHADNDIRVAARGAKKKSAAGYRYRYRLQTTGLVLR